MYERIIRTLQKRSYEQMKKESTFNRKKLRIRDKYSFHFFFFFEIQISIFHRKNKKIKKKKHKTPKPLQTFENFVIKSKPRLSISPINNILNNTLRLVITF